MLETATNSLPYRNNAASRPQHKQRRRGSSHSTLKLKPMRLESWERTDEDELGLGYGQWLRGSSFYCTTKVRGRSDSSDYVSCTSTAVVGISRDAVTVEVEGHSGEKETSKGSVDTPIEQNSPTEVEEQNGCIIS
jgi:hypothetical protein